MGTPGAAPPQACCALQGRACRLQGKEDAQDFKGLVKALRVLGLCAEELTEVWAVLAAILHLGNICFSSSEVGSPVMGPASTQDGQWWAVCTIRVMMMPGHCVWKITGHWAASGSRQIPMVWTRKVSPSPAALLTWSQPKKPLPGDVSEDPLTLCKRNLILMSTLCPNGYCFPPSDKAAEGQKEKGTGRNYLPLRGDSPGSH